MYSVPVIAFAAPLFFLFEIVQLVMAERLVGVLTFEGAIRVGMLLALMGRMWRTLH